MTARAQRGGDRTAPELRKERARPQPPGRSRKRARACRQDLGSVGREKPESPWHRASRRRDRG
jgi:hypothetical protein